MDRYVCIHGHFYQPPRENPWLEAIELQDSAYPYHDWNERITAECYLPNATSRILDGEGRILRIQNNYSRISFNFGPTLLAWMEEKAPEVYRAILAGDRESQKKFSGHGSALAQVIQYAGRAIQLSEELFGGSLEPQFLERLEKARSNIPDHGNGRHIYEKVVKPAMVNLEKVGAHYAIRSLFEPYAEHDRIYCFTVDREAYPPVPRRGGKRGGRGQDLGEPFHFAGRQAPLPGGIEPRKRWK